MQATQLPIEENLFGLQQLLDFTSRSIEVQQAEGSIEKSDLLNISATFAQVKKYADSIQPKTTEQEQLKADLLLQLSLSYKLLSGIASQHIYAFTHREF